MVVAQAYPPMNIRGYVPTSRVKPNLSMLSTTFKPGPTDYADSDSWHRQCLTRSVNASTTNKAKALELKQ